MYLKYVLLPVLAAASHGYAEEITVTSNMDSGEGSLRAALLMAAQSPEPTTILITADGNITLESGLTYEGDSDLALKGRGQVISLPKDETILTATGGAAMQVSQLSLRGPGEWSLTSRSESETAVAGLYVSTVAGQENDLMIDLRDVTISGVSGHGVHITDCFSGDICGGEVEGEGEGSAAGIAANFDNVEIRDTGLGRYDADGLRIDERGAGNILFTARNSHFTGNGADGIELDEGQAGDVVLSMQGGSVIGNGFYCDPEVLEPAIAEPIEAEFEQGEMQESDLPGPVSGSADDACIEFEVDTYDDGTVEAYEYEVDVEDGFDADETGDGTLYVSMNGVEISGNHDEGMDFDEDGPGHIIGNFDMLVLNDNADDALKLSERDDGATMAFITGGTASSNGDSGYLIEEEDAGDLHTTLSGVESSGNGGYGIEIVQDNEGSGRAILTDVEVSDGVDWHGVSMN